MNSSMIAALSARPQKFYRQTHHCCRRDEYFRLKRNRVPFQTNLVHWHRLYVLLYWGEALRLWNHSRQLCPVAYYLKCRIIKFLRFSHFRQLSFLIFFNWNYMKKLELHVYERKENREREIYRQIYLYLLRRMCPRQQNSLRLIRALRDRHSLCLKAHKTFLLLTLGCWKNYFKTKIFV